MTDQPRHGLCRMGSDSHLMSRSQPWWTDSSRTFTPRTRSLIWSRLSGLDVTPLKLDFSGMLNHASFSLLVLSGVSHNRFRFPRRDRILLAHFINPQGRMKVTLRLAPPLSCGKVRPFSRWHAEESVFCDTRLLARNATSSLEVGAEKIWTSMVVSY